MRNTGALTLRLFCLSACTLAPVLGVQANSYPAYPDGWEKRADPRFNPPVEEVARALSFLPSKQALRDAEWNWHQWGPEAIPVVQRLRAKPEWSDFRHGFTVLLSVCSLEEGAVARNEIFFDSLARDSHGFQSTPATHEFMGIFIQYNRRAAMKFLSEIAGRDDATLQLLAARWLQDMGDQVRPLVDRIITRYEESDSEALRKHVAGLLLSRYTPKDVERALRIARTVSDEYHTALLESVNRFQGKLRANEPMRIILEEERADESD